MKPKNIFLVRHGQSEGNVNKEIHWTTPDWKINLTDHGKEQAEHAGEKILKKLSNESTHRPLIGFYISPYNRTIQTLEGIKKSFKQEDIGFEYQDPRIREQEYGNGMTSSEAYKIEKERVAYGTFFYRIKDGESGADVYDRCATFLDTLHRDFEKINFPENLVIVTHGFTLRVFLMKWFHYTVQEFENLKNPQNCQIVQLSLKENGKYELITQMEKRN